MNYTLIPATENDKPFIYALKKSSIFQYVNEIWRWDELYQVKDFNDSFILKNFEIIVVHNSNVGFIETYENDDIINISEIHIQKQYQGRGIGSSIIKTIIDKACDQNKIITFGCFKKNSSAKTLYERLGFIVKEETRSHFLFEYNPSCINVKQHYNSLIDENNDPVHNPNLQ